MVAKQTGLKIIQRSAARFPYSLPAAILRFSVPFQKVAQCLKQNSRVLSVAIGYHRLFVIVIIASIVTTITFLMVWAAVVRATIVSGKSCRSSSVYAWTEKQGNGRQKMLWQKYQGHSAPCTYVSGYLACHCFSIVLLMLLSILADSSLVAGRSWIELSMLAISAIVVVTRWLTLSSCRKTLYGRAVSTDWLGCRCGGKCTTWNYHNSVTCAARGIASVKLYTRGKMHRDILCLSCFHCIK